LKIGKSHHLVKYLRAFIHKFESGAEKPACGHH